MTCIKRIILIIIFLKVQHIVSIWPPDFKVNISNEEVFVISEPLERSEFEDVYEEEEELIKKEDIERLNVQSHRDKFYSLHKNFKDNKKRPTLKVEVHKKRVYEEFNPDKEYEEPYKGKFLNNNDDIIYFEDDEVKSNLKHKRSQSKNNSEENYDYVKLQAAFNKQIKESVKSNNTLNYTEVKEDETIKDSIKVLFNMNQTRNCTEEEKKGIGLAAVECLWQDLKKPKLKNHVLERIFRLVLIWLCVYMIIAIPCWCQHGWCCCCFTCKFCKPQENIEEVKQFFTQNPPGIFHDENGKVIKYKPTEYERYAQKRLEDELRNL